MCKKAKEKYPVSRGFSLAWLLAFTKSFVLLASGMIVSLFFIPGTKNKVTSNSPLTSDANKFVKYLLKAKKERNICSQGKQGSSFLFLPPPWLGAQCLEPVKPGCQVYDFNGKAKIS